MDIQINGVSHQLPAALTLTALIEHLGHSGRRIAIERNGEIVPKGLHSETLLQGGDRLEIVVAVGGG
ncbi:thiamine biosynthesis protein ThiS [Chitinimonas sp. BJB300]|nr:thiamine biosynthesis protein ThiS [Chitinimonas sp. BJB300]TSJ91685.1 sulfur carrier protein ThiS [Chitinimonas sp. BJB300]